MAKTERAPGGAPGDWFVDDRCINCGAVRHIAPDLIVELRGKSVFRRQPQTEGELRQAWLASEMCPTRSVRHESHKTPPAGLYPHQLADTVYLCGHNSPKSYGAHSYLLLREDGNVLIDSPVFTKQLVGPFTEMGGISKIFLSHSDDVADADKWAAHFDAQIYIHKYDRKAAPYATNIIEGESPTDTTELAKGLCVIPIPGHTRGSMALLVDNRFLFTGDSLCWLPQKNRLHAFRNVCWYSWPVQKESLHALTSYDFTRVFSGHGSFSPEMSTSDLREHLRDLVARM